MQTTYCASAGVSRLRHRQPGSRSSPVELRADLTDAGIARIGDDSEVGVANIAARIHKLRMVEYVEKFDAEGKSIILFNFSSLQKPKVSGVTSGTVEDAPVGGAKSAHIGVNSKCARKQVASRSWLRRVDSIRTTGISFARIHNHHRAHNIWHIRSRTAGERSIALALLHLNGKAASEPCDPLHLPALRQG